VDKPAFTITIQHKKLSTTIFEPGKYVTTWSGGKTKTYTLSSPNPVSLLSGKWEIRFDTKWGGPAQIETDSLRSWTKFDDRGIRYYSGSAVYKKHFTVAANALKEKTVLLDLGNVLEMASIIINGHKMPVKWSAPFQFDISNEVKAGENLLEVEVVNLWPNRLIGDSKLPISERLTKTNIMKYDGSDSEKYLRESGLLGPVSIRFIHFETGQLQK